MEKSCDGVKICGDFMKNLLLSLELAPVFVEKSCVGKKNYINLAGKSVCAKAKMSVEQEEKSANRVEKLWWVVLHI